MKEKDLAALADKFFEGPNKSDIILDISAIPAEQIDVVSVK